MVDPDTRYDVCHVIHIAGSEAAGDEFLGPRRSTSTGLVIAWRLGGRHVDASAREPRRGFGRIVAQRSEVTRLGVATVGLQDLVAALCERCSEARADAMQSSA